MKVFKGGDGKGGGEIILGQERLPFDSNSVLMGNDKTKHITI